jgi:NAD(P)-dependent dehydrogenase (short-subunit alcohol dehydrogenase family)
MPADLTNADDVRRMADEALSPRGTIDILVNNTCVSLKWFARQASRFGCHGTRTVGIGFRRRSKVAPQALVGATGRIPKRLRFYEDAAKVVQRGMVPNFKKSFERAVRTARR